MITYGNQHRPRNLRTGLTNREIANLINRETRGRKRNRRPRRVALAPREAHARPANARRIGRRPASTATSRSFTPPAETDAPRRVRHDPREGGMPWAGEAPEHSYPRRRFKPHRRRHPGRGCKLPQPRPLSPSGVVMLAAGCWALIIGFVAYHGIQEWRQDRRYQRAFDAHKRALPRLRAAHH